MVIKKTKYLLEKYEYIWSPVLMVLGFILDNLFLQKVDTLGSQIFLITYLSLVFLNIILSFKYRKPIFLMAIQFFLGGLFSNYFVFYIKGASLVSSWPFIALIFVYLIANEFLKKYYEHLLVRISVFYLALYSFLIFFIPTTLKEISSKIFLLSGVISLIIIYFLILILFLINKNEIKSHFKKVILNIFSIFILINTFYFLHVIPPLPLSIKEIGIYGNIVKDQKGNYIKTSYDKNVIKAPVFVFSAVYSPFNLNTTVYHLWEKYSVADKEWQVKANVPISIIGGREEGYRMYSEKQNLESGSWRVSVVTKNNLIVGRKYFSY